MKRNIWWFGGMYIIFDATKQRIMQLNFKGSDFGKALKQKRIINEEIDLRAAAKRLKTSAATLSRCENGHFPDLITYAKLCFWIGRNMNEFIEIKLLNSKK